MTTIFIHPTNGRLHRDDLVGTFPDAELVEPEDAADVPGALAAADGPTVLLTNNDSFSHDYLDALDAGDWVAATATGYDIYDFDRFEARDVALTHMPTVYGAAVSQHAVAMALAVSRRLYDYHELQTESRWEKLKVGTTDFGGDVACVIGLGHIGEAVATRLDAFDMTVRGVKRDVEGYDGAADEVYAEDELLAALDGAALVVLTVPLTESTRGLLDGPALDACAEDAIVVNVARGPVLDADALVRALDAGSIRAACLDVFDDEPLPADSPLWDRDDVFVTPHIAGWSDKLPGRAHEVFEAQYRAWTADESLPHRLV